MNTCRICPCQAGFNSPVGLMKGDNIQREVEGRQERKRQAEGTKVGEDSEEGIERK